MGKTVEELEAELQELKGSLEAVASKNKELLGELKTERKKNRDGEVDSDKFYALQDKFEEMHEQNKKLQHELKGKDKELNKVLEENNSLNANLQNVIVDGGLADSLAKVGVKKEFLDVTKAFLKGKSEIVDGKAMIDGKPLDEYMQSWAETDGKAFVAAQENSGSGGQGGTTGGQGNTQKRSEMSLSQRGAFIRENGEEAYLKLEN